MFVIKMRKRTKINIHLHQMRCFGSFTNVIQSVSNSMELNPGSDFEKNAYRVVTADQWVFIEMIYYKIHH